MPQAATIAWWLDGSWGGGGIAHTKNLADTVTASDAAVKAIRKPGLADSLTLTDDRALAPRKVLSDTVTGTDISSRRPALGRTDAFALSDASDTDLPQAVGKARTDTLTLTDVPTLTRGTLLELADQIGLGDLPDLQFSDVLEQEPADSLSLTDTLALSLSLVLADSCGLVDNVTPTTVRVGLDPLEFGDLSEDVVVLSVLSSATPAFASAYPGVAYPGQVFPGQQGSVLVATPVDSTVQLVSAATGGTLTLTPA